MGNSFSTRWSSIVVRQDTDPLLKLDVRWLSRIGALRPGATAQPSWRRGQHQIGSITTYVGAHSPHVLILDYLTGRAGEELQFVRDAVPLRLTPCNL